MADRKKGKKRSKAFYIRGSSSKKMRREKSLDVGMRGFLLTCNRAEQLCVRDAYSLLAEYADNLYRPEKTGDNGASSENESESDPEDIEASLRKEVAQMKQQQTQKERRFEAISSGANNVVFIRTKLPDPTELVHHLLTDISTSQTSKSCHIMRMLPVNMTCRATADDITKYAPEFLHPYFHAANVAATTFAVQIKIRNNASVQRDEVIKLVAGIVMEKGIPHKVDLQDPELSVVVEIIKNVCCLSVVRDYNKLKRYNLQEIVSGGGVGAGKALTRRSAKGMRRQPAGEFETKDADETSLHQDKASEVEDEEKQELVISDTATVGNDDARRKCDYEQDRKSEHNSEQEREKLEGNDKLDKEDRTLSPSC